MIGERYAPDVRVRPLETTRTGGLRPVGMMRAAISRPQQRAEVLGQSLPVQLGLVLSLFAFAAMIYIFQASQADVLQMNINTLQAHAAQIASDNSALETQATSLRSINRVDMLATTRLHMLKADASSVMWIQPAVPSIAPIHDVNADVARAQRQSQPLAWMAAVADAVRSSL